MDEEQDQFIADAREMVERLDRDLEQLRAVRAQGRRRRELAARIFRRVHTLKGSAGSLGLELVSRIAHEFEGVLDGARLGRIDLTEELIDLFAAAADAISHALEKEADDAFLPTARDLIDRLRAMAASCKKQGTIANSLRAALPADIARALSEYDLQHAREAIREGARLFIVSAGFSLETFDQPFRELSRLLGQSGEIVATVPGEGATTGEINFCLLYAAEYVSNEVLRQASALGRIELSELKIEPLTSEERVSFAAGPALSQPLTESESVSVRLPLDELNELISETSDLYRDTAKILESVTTPEKIPAILRRRFIELQERLIKLRLVPCAEIFERAATRAGRIAARQLGKHVEFEIKGGDVGIDKTQADALAEPLLHLVRNAVKHGIETPEERTVAGKSAVGKVTLASVNEGSEVHITVADDGRGIDTRRVVAAAGEHGIATSRDALSVDQCLRLIFRPGFSTDTEASELSGRGIGLDVVDRAMEDAGGSVRVATENGIGTTFLMILPAALALVDCVIVRSGAQLYGLRSARVVDCRSLDESEMKRISNAETIDWDGETLPVFSLRRLLSQATEDGDHKRDAIVWQCDANRATRGWKGRFALIVDSTLGSQETLVRGLGRYSSRWHGVSGAAELPDGSVALVLDIEQLIEAQA